MSGPNISVCTRNGNWEPELGEVVCMGDYCMTAYLFISVSVAINLKTVTII